MLVYPQFVELDSGRFVFINWVLIKCRQPAKKTGYFESWAIYFWGNG